MKKEPVTLELIAEKIENLDGRFNAMDNRFDSLTSIVEELAEATYNGFARVEEVLATKADKADVIRLETKVDQAEQRLDGCINALGMKIDDLGEEVNSFTSDVYDELSGRIAVLEKKRM